MFKNKKLILFILKSCKSRLFLLSIASLFFYLAFFPTEYKEVTGTILIKQHELSRPSFLKNITQTNEPWFYPDRYKVVIELPGINQRVMVDDKKLYDSFFPDVKVRYRQFQLPLIGSFGLREYTVLKDNIR